MNMLLYYNRINNKFNMEYIITHNVERERFETVVENLMSVIEYRIDNEGNMDITHTGVPRELEGRGIAAALTRYMLEYAKNNAIKIRPLCPYTSAYIRKHPEYEELIKR